MIYFCPFLCLYFYYIFVLLSFWSFCLSFNFPAFIFWRVQLVSRRSRLPLCVWILSLRDDYPATKIPHRDHTAPYIQISYIYKYKYHIYQYKYKSKYHCLPFIVNTAPYIWCAYILHHVLPCRRIGAGVIFWTTGCYSIQFSSTSINPGFFQTTFILICSFLHNFYICHGLFYIRINLAFFAVF